MATKRQAQQATKKIDTLPGLDPQLVRGISVVNVGTRKKPNWEGLIYLLREAAKDEIPDQVDGVRIKTIVIGRVLPQII